MAEQPLPETSVNEADYALPAPVHYKPTSPWDGLSIYQTSVAQSIHRAVPELPWHVIRAAVGWIRTGELGRHYGVGFSVAYSIRAALREGALVVGDVA